MFLKVIPLLQAFSSTIHVFRTCGASHGPSASAELLVILKSKLHVNSCFSEFCIQWHRCTSNQVTPTYSSNSTRHRTCFVRTNVRVFGLNATSEIRKLVGSKHGVDTISVAMVSCSNSGINVVPGRLNLVILDHSARTEDIPQFSSTHCL